MIKSEEQLNEEECNKILKSDCTCFPDSGTEYLMFFFLSFCIVQACRLSLLGGNEMNKTGFPPSGKWVGFFCDLLSEFLILLKQQGMVALSFDLHGIGLGVQLLKWLLSLLSAPSVSGSCRNGSCSAVCTWDWRVAVLGLSHFAEGLVWIL